MSRIQVVLLLLLGTVHTAHAQQSAAPWPEVGRVLGVAPAAAGGTQRYAFPRSDLRVTVAGAVLEPAFALTSWAAFAAGDGDTVVMGDLVLTADELPPVVRQLSAEGLAVRAIHNHLVGEAPRVMYVHYEGHGGAVDLAQRLARVLTLSGTPRPVAAMAPRPVTIDTVLAFSALGARGRAEGPLVFLGFPLIQGSVTMHGRPVPSGFGLGSPINFQSVSAERWIATGDFAVTAERVQPILDALAANGIAVTALHNHLMGETPSVYFMHFWADGTPAAVTRGLRSALDAAR